MSLLSFLRERPVLAFGWAVCGAFKIVIVTMRLNLRKNDGGGLFCLAP